MMGMKLHKKSEKEMNYNISQVHKISYALFSLVMLIGLFSAPLSTMFTFRSIIPLFFLLISLTGLGYREKWEFDAIKREVRSINGVFFIVKREIIPFDKISHIEISHFTKGFQQPKKLGDRGRNKSMTVFSIRLVDDSVRQIEIIPERVSHGRTHQVAYVIAHDMNLPFKADREYDTINPVELSDL
jgi:hypothetical protein